MSSLATCLDCGKLISLVFPVHHCEKATKKPKKAKRKKFEVSVSGAADVIVLASSEAEAKRIVKARINLCKPLGDDGDHGLFVPDKIIDCMEVEDS